jgi:hypothetical protein
MNHRANSATSRRERHEEHSGLVDTLIEAVAGPHAEQDPPVQSRDDLGRFKEYMEGLPAPAGN